MERYTIRGGRAGYARLQVLARVRRAGTVELLRRMWGAVRPGGAIAVEDTDYDGCQRGR